MAMASTNSRTFNLQLTKTTACILKVSRVATSTGRPKRLESFVLLRLQRNSLNRF